MKVEPCVPTWEAAMMIYLASIENPDAPAEVRADAREEVYRCGRLLDEAQEEMKRLREDA